VDGAASFDESDVSIARRLNGKRHVTVVNKIDLEQSVREEDLRRVIKGGVVKISALFGLGLEELKRSVVENLLNESGPPREGIFITHVRHREVLRKTGKAIRRALETMEAGLSEEFVAVDVRHALVSVGEITGETATEEVLERIFSEFCIGK